MSRIIIAIGASAPQFTGDALVDGKIDKDVPFAPNEDGYKVLFFYSGDFTQVSSKEIRELKDMEDHFDQIGCKIYGVSVDSVHSHKVWCEKEINNTGFPLFSDVSRRISASYSALSPEGNCYNSTFIIDGKGRIRWFSHTDPAIQRNVSEILNMVKELKNLNV